MAAITNKRLILLPNPLLHDDVGRDEDFGDFDNVSFTIELIKWGVAMSISYYLTQVRPLCKSFLHDTLILSDVTLLLNFLCPIYFVLEETA